MTPSDRTFIRRLERVSRRAAELQLEGFLVRHGPNIRYLTGFSGSSALLLVPIDSTDRSLFVTDGRYELQAEDELPAAGIELIIARDGLARLLGRLEGVRLGFEADHTSVAMWRRMRVERKEVEWVETAGLVEEQRAVKEPGEVAAIRAAARLALEAYEAMRRTIRPGVREADLAAELDHQMRRRGAEGPAFETIVASGPRSALPHALSGDRKLEEGDLVLCDFGARKEAYCCDLTRTLVMGPKSSRQQEVYSAVVEARGAALRVLRAGSTGAGVDAMVRARLRARGFADEMAHSSGHGLGLEVHEAPRLRRGSSEPLSENMVVTLEPGLYFGGWGGIRLEDDYLITGGRPEPMVEPAPGELEEA